MWKFLPLGAATHLSYQLRFIGGEYSYEEEVKYWRGRDAWIRNNEVLLPQDPSRRSRETLTMTEAADYLCLSEKQIRHMIFDTRELRRCRYQPPLLTRNELDRWADHRMKINAVSS